jgi:hypothetical protein
MLTVRCESYALCVLQAGLKDAIAALESLDSASIRKRVCSQLTELFNYLAAVHRKNGNQLEVSNVVFTVSTNSCY